MKAWLFFVLTLFCVSKTAQSCSCVEGSFSLPRSSVIRRDFCSRSMVYIARVVGARCSCYTNSTLNCVSYDSGTPESTDRTAQVIAMGVCDEQRTENLNTCANLNQALSVSVDIAPGIDLPTINLTARAKFGRCPMVVCPFNEADPDNIEISNNPCQYTVELLEVFKPTNYTGPTNITVLGPDVLTTCGNPDQRLRIGETYLAGVGGGCSPINGWSTRQSYSTDELNLLRELRLANPTLLCGATVSVPSILTLLLSALIILAVAA